LKQSLSQHSQHGADLTKNSDFLHVGFSELQVLVVSMLHLKRPVVSSRILIHFCLRQSPEHSSRVESGAFQVSPGTRCVFSWSIHSQYSSVTVTVEVVVVLPVVVPVVVVPVVVVPAVVVVVLPGVTVTVTVVGTVVEVVPVVEET
jgi:hypothetical protein